MSAPDPATVTAVVLADGSADAGPCLAALSAAGPGEVVLVDATADGLPPRAGVIPVRPAPGSGRAAALSAGAAAARREDGWLLFLDAGAEPEPAFLPPLLAAAAAPGRGVAGPRLALPSGALSDGLRLAWARPFPLTPVPVADIGAVAGGRTALEVAAVGGGALLVEAALFRRLGGFDPGYREALEDVDLCLRAGEAGRSTAVARASVVRVRRGPTARHALPDLARLARRWLGKVPLHDLDRLRAAAAPAPHPDRPPLTVVVPLLDQLARVARGLEEVRRALGPEDELVLADAGSEDGTAEYGALLAREAPWRRRVVASPRERGVAGAVAAGLAAASRPVAALLHLPDSPPGGLLDEATQLLAQSPGLAFLAFPAPPAGVCAVGSTEALRLVAAGSAEAFLEAGTASLERAATAAGVPAAFAG